jgi:hypothetical protein
MSLNLAESTLVLAKIRAHHGNAPITDLEARTFQEELRADATLSDALEAVKNFYAANTTGRWMLGGDVNAGMRAIRKKRLPEEAQIENLMAQASIDSDHALTYRRQLIKAMSMGQDITQAHALAVEASHRLAVEAPKPDHKPKPEKQLTGTVRVADINLENMIGGTL